MLTHWHNWTSARFRNSPIKNVNLETSEPFEKGNTFMTI